MRFFNKRPNVFIASTNLSQPNLTQSSGIKKSFISPHSSLKYIKIILQIEF
jgi:hypothetical protein